MTGTFVITTVLMTVVALKKWKLSPWLVWPVSLFFFIVDSAFFLANLTKFDSGGWFPLAVAAVIFALLTTWRAGRGLMREQMIKRSPAMTDFAESIDRSKMMVLPGTSVYLAANTDRTPSALVQHVKLLHLIAQNTVILHLETADRPRVTDDERIVITKMSPTVSHIVATFGFMERVDVGLALRLAHEQGVNVDPQTCTYFLHSVSVEPIGETSMWLPRQQLFAVMQRIAVDPTLYLHLPNARVIEIGTTVRL